MGALARTFQNQGGTAITDQLLSRNETPLGSRQDYLAAEIVGESPHFRRVLHQIETVAATDATVLIRGETGTGKELVAKAIHSLSRRKDRAFVSMNCASIPAGLLEAELFGHEKGAYTGAVARAIGRCELADKGTLFLDEIGDTPIELQSKLLRVLQEQEFERLGSSRTLRVDFRLLAATNQDLGQMVERAQFRSDLYYRLNVFPIDVPPLRQRAQDIVPLVWHFIKKYAQRMNRRIDTIREEDMNAMAQYEWPGNVRELQNFIERSVILSTDAFLRPPVVELGQGVRLGGAKSRSLAEAERRHIVDVLRDTDWVVGGPNGAAAMLDVKRTTLLDKMRRLRIARPVV
jgi:formate hydrogenlyase transcriptional activator